MNIEIHILQNFSPSCLNRDDTNTPKSCLFGDARRARISSQCLKRTIRQHMKAHYGIPTGERTRRLAGAIADRLERDRTEAESRALRALAAAGFKHDKDENRTQVGLYLSEEEIASLAAAVNEDWDRLGAAEASDAPPEATETEPKRRGKKEKPKGPELPAVQVAFSAIHGKVTAADIALFGRMIAERTHMKVDAACQVAHAISTHEVEPEMDYFTAVDDLQPNEEPGAGMLGITEFNSACYYRYALINREQLIANLNGDAALANRTIAAFVESSLRAIPSARQNSSAAQNPPDYLQVVVGASSPQSLSNAFVRPVRAGAGGLTEHSIAALRRYEGALATMYGTDGDRMSASTADGAGDCTVPELLDWLGKRLGGP